MIITNEYVVLIFHFTIIDSSKPDYIIGDYDNDGAVTVVDALAVLRIAVKLV